MKEIARLIDTTADHFSCNEYDNAWMNSSSNDLREIRSAELAALQSFQHHRLDLVLTNLPSTVTSTLKVLLYFLAIIVL